MATPFTNTAGAEANRWLLLFNCQATGLGNCLNLLGRQLRIDVYDPATFEDEKAAVVARLRESTYSQLLVRANAPELREFPTSVRRAVRQVPAMLFHGYHPDFCYLAASGPLSQGPTGHYHSAIAYAAFHCGLDEQQAAALFNGKVYEQLGYYEAWDSERERIFLQFDKWDLDIRRAFVDWSRNGPFMFTTNHPRIGVLHDLARILLEQAGEPLAQVSLQPHDNLANAIWLPVYPEIGMRIGVEGSYVFKRGGSYETFGLDEFIAGCFAVYRAHPELKASYEPYALTLQRAIDLVATMA